mmetsp:Transcript_49402/g.138984  ORF Transcript_49402/g.138984 Transcript_49402/m.138984 type:complete len:247 (+) Transcript_49402:1567-2307(+)
MSFSTSAILYSMSMTEPLSFWSSFLLVLPCSSTDSCKDNSICSFASSAFDIDSSLALLTSPAMSWRAFSKASAAALAVSLTTAWRLSLVAPSSWSMRSTQPWSSCRKASRVAPSTSKMRCSSASRLSLMLPSRRGFSASISARSTRSASAMSARAISDAFSTLCSARLACSWLALSRLSCTSLTSPRSRSSSAASLSCSVFSTAVDVALICCSSCAFCSFSSSMVAVIFFPMAMVLPPKRQQPSNG